MTTGCVAGQPAGLADTVSVRVALEELGRVYDWIDTFADRMALPRACRVALQIVAEEAVSNIIRHGYPKRPPEPADRIWLTLEAQGDTLLLTIEDSAVAFDPRAVVGPPKAASLEEMVPGGQGIPLMRRRTQAMDYERRDGMNRLTLRFRPVAEPAAALA